MGSIALRVSKDEWIELLILILITHWRKLALDFVNIHIDVQEIYTCILIYSIYSYVVVYEKWEADKQVNEAPKLSI